VWEFSYEAQAEDDAAYEAEARIRRQADEVAGRS